MKPIEIKDVVVGEYHDFISMNHKEVVFNPTSEDSARILKEGDISDLPETEQKKAINKFLVKLGSHPIFEESHEESPL